MRRILLISPEQRFRRDLQSCLEESGLYLSSQETLEEAFFRVSQPVFSVIIIDEEALSSSKEDNIQMLRWFRVRSFIILVTSSGMAYPRTAGQIQVSRRMEPEKLAILVKQLAYQGLGSKVPGDSA